MTITRQYVDTREGQVHVHSAGRPGSETIVMIHKTGGSAAGFNPLMRTLSDEYRTLAPDMPGFGESYDPDPERVSDMHYYTRVIGEALDQLKVKEFHALGHHTGVCVTVELAVERPDRVQSATMIGPLELSEEERDRYREEFSGDDREMPPDPDGQYLRDTWDYVNHLGAERSLEVQHRAILSYLRCYEARGIIYDLVWDFDFPGFCSRVGCPRLFMAAPDDVLWPAFERARKRYPKASFAVTGGANFEPELDTSGVAEALTSFITKRCS